MTDIGTSRSVTHEPFAGLERRFPFFSSKGMMGTEGRGIGLRGESVSD